MDIAILVALTLCQAITGYMGFHVSIITLTSQQRLRWRLYFVAITLFGVGLVVWSGVRSANVQDQILAILSPPPRVTISQVVPIKLPKENDLRFNVYFSNSGQHEIRGLTTHFGIATASGLISKDIEDKIFRDLERLTPPPAASTDMMEPGEPRNTTFPGQLDQHSGLTDAAVKGHVVYLAIVLGYFDARTKDIWYTEWCEFWDFRIPQELWPRMNAHKCFGHNGTIGPRAK